MSHIQSLLKEMEREAQTTRKFLSIVPEDNYDWKPHEKSMGLLQLATHLAELPMWVSMTLTSSELDLASDAYQPQPIRNGNELMAFFESTLSEGKNQLARSTDETLLPNWTLRSGDQIHDVSPRSEVIRMIYCQVVHHRAQLGVYLRLLNIPLPGSYGPTADELTH